MERMSLYFDRFDVCEAYDVFATYWHKGQWSKEYAIFGRLSKLQFRPAPNLDINTLTHNGRMILSGLIRRQLAEDRTGHQRPGSP